MTPRNWKTAQPSSLSQALEWSIEYARIKRNLSVDRIAEQMGMASNGKWTLYKWIVSGKMPIVITPTFELVCGINLVSRWLSASGGKLLIDIPTGRVCEDHDIQQLQTVLHATVGALMNFYAGREDATATMASVHVALENLAWHRRNVQQHATPQLDLGGSHDE